MRPRMGGSGARAPRARAARHAQLTCHDLIDVAREHIAFEIDAVAGPAVAERRHGERVRDHGDRERPCRALEHGETDAVDRDRALFDEVASERRRDAEAEERAVAFTRDRAQLADAVDVTEDEMAAQAVGEAERALEVDALPGSQRAERRPAHALRRHVDDEGRAADARHGHAGPAHGDALADPEAAWPAANREPRAATRRRSQGRDLADALDDAAEHGLRCRAGVSWSSAGASEVAREPVGGFVTRGFVELVLVEPRAAALLALFDRDAVVRRWGERLPALRAPHLRRAWGGRLPAYLFDELAVALGEIRVLASALDVAKLVSVPVLLISHRPASVTAFHVPPVASPCAPRDSATMPSLAGSRSRATTIP